MIIFFSSPVERERTWEEQREGGKKNCPSAVVCVCDLFVSVKYPTDADIKTADVETPIFVLKKWQKN